MSPSKRLRALAWAILSLTFLLVPALAQAQTGPRIVDFHATIADVDRSALAERRARVPVTWEVANRAIWMALEFDQVLPDGMLINVELPRSSPWVNSSGSGLAAPILPSPDATAITLRLTMRNLISGVVHDVRDFTLPIREGGGGSTIGGLRPTITRFGTSLASIRALDLQAGTLLVPVTWTTARRPLSANLVFEQVLPDGSSVNVELPRSNPWVNSSGSGQVKPLLPADGVSPVMLRLRLVEILSRRILDQRFLSIPVDYSGTGSISIAVFEAERSSVDASRLASSQGELVPVRWQVINRSNDLNLYFEQVMPDGSVRSAELPRSNPWVASSGTGTVQLILPPGSATEVVVRLQLRSLVNNLISDERTIRLPIVHSGSSSGAGAPAITRFEANPASATLDGSLTFAWEVSGADQVILNLPGKYLDNLPLTGTLTVRVSELATSLLPLHVELLALDSTGTQPGAVAMRDIEVATSHRIRSFTADAPASQRTTLRWEIEGTFTTAYISTTNYRTQTILIERRINSGENNGTLAVELPPVSAEVLYTLTVEDSEGRRITAQVAVPSTCPYTYFVSDPEAQRNTCPENNVQTIPLAIQNFERGRMIWIGQPQPQIFALYNDGGLMMAWDSWNNTPIAYQGITAPAGLFLPERGFGWVWMNVPGVRDRLGFATAPEQGYSGQVQRVGTFYRGQVTGTTYVTLPDGTTLAIDYMSGARWRQLP